MINRNYDIYSIEERVHNLEMGGSPTPGGGSWDYSTEETDTHQKWIDGKEIYCKVIEGTFNFTTNNQVEITTTEGIEKLIDGRAFGDTIPSVTSCQFYFDNGKVMGHNPSQFNASKIILYYTKTELTKTKRGKK
jgi:hypothetical protein